MDAWNAGVAKKSISSGRLGNIERKGSFDE